MAYLRFCDVVRYRFPEIFGEDPIMVVNDPGTPDGDTCIVTVLDSELSIKPVYTLPKDSLRVLGQTSAYESIDNIIQKFSLPHR